MSEVLMAVVESKMRRNSLSVAAISIARNEQAHIGEVLTSLQAQSVHVNPIIVVNDGSSDKTGDIALSLGCIVIDLPAHKKSYAGKPELAKIVNVGLTYLRDLNLECNYVLIIGADHVLSNKYLETIISRMERNQKLVVASGIIDGEFFEIDTPRGSGRVVNYFFWLNLNNLQYPVEWGWESWLYLKAQSLGLETRCFPDIHSQVRRSTSLDKAGNWGKAMYALGYDWKYALGRCIVTFLKNPRAGNSMFWKWLFHKNVRKFDIAEWVNKYQKRIFWKKVIMLMKIT